MIRLLICAAVAAIIAGCGGAPQSARHALTITAGAVAATQEIALPVYSARADMCFETLTADGVNGTFSEADYRECVRGVDALEQALRTARPALMATQAGIDAWDAGDEGTSFMATVPCIAAALASLSVAIQEAGVDMPGELRQALVLVGAFGGTCHE